MQKEHSKTHTVRKWHLLFQVTCKIVIRRVNMFEETGQCGSLIYYLTRRAARIHTVRIRKDKD